MSSTIVNDHVVVDIDINNTSTDMSATAIATAAHVDDSTPASVLSSISGLNRNVKKTHYLSILNDIGVCSKTYAGDNSIRAVMSIVSATHDLFKILQVVWNSIVNKVHNINKPHELPKSLDRLHTVMNVYDAAFAEEMSSAFIQIYSCEEFNLMQCISEIPKESCLFINLPIETASFLASFAEKTKKIINLLSADDLNVNFNNFI